MPEELVKPEELSKYRQVASHVGLHSASIPGILALDLCPSDTNKILTGGADKNVVVFDKSSEQILATLKGHTKKVTSVVFHPSQELVFSASLMLLSGFGRFRTPLAYRLFVPTRAL